MPAENTFQFEQEHTEVPVPENLYKGDSKYLFVLYCFVGWEFIFKFHFRVVLHPTDDFNVWNFNRYFYIKSIPLHDGVYNHGDNRRAYAHLVYGL